jgi:hypothetical protein
MPKTFHASSSSQERRRPESSKPGRGLLNLGANRPKNAYSQKWRQIAEKRNLLNEKRYNDLNMFLMFFKFFCKWLETL